MTAPDIRILDSVTHLDAQAAGCVLICGSHGGILAAAIARTHAVRAAIFSDAGIGRDRAGISGLAWLEECGIAAAAVAHTSARIGDGADLAARGIISHANPLATGAGVRVRMSCISAANRLLDFPFHAASPVENPSQPRRRLLEAGDIRVWALDSASDVLPSDAGSIVVTGSHGGLLGGRTGSAIKAPVVAAVYNDAGTGMDRAGVSRLPALDAQGISGATVAASSARIGDGCSTYFDGVLSAVNAMASARGARVGMSTKEFVAATLRATMAEARRCV